MYSGLETLSGQQDGAIVGLTPFVSLLSGIIVLYYFSIPENCCFINFVWFFSSLTSEGKSGPCESIMAGSRSPPHPSLEK